MLGNVFDEKMSAQGMRFAVVVSRFNQAITLKLQEGCLKSLTEHGAKGDDIEVHHVPGSFELPAVTKVLAQTGRFAAVVALGAVIKGETPHFEYVCDVAANGIARAFFETEVPVIFGVITTNTLDQAQDRTRNDKSNKGYEAGMAAIEMAQLMRGIKK